MDIWQDLKTAIDETGVRVQERLELLERIRKEGGASSLQDDLDDAGRRLRGAADELRREAMGR